MLYLFCGSDVEGVRRKAFAWVTAAKAKQPQAPYVRLGVDDITESTLASVAASQGLFFRKTLVLLDDPFALKEAGECVLDNLLLLKESENPIAILAPKLLAARAKKIEAVSEKTFRIDLKTEKVPRGFNGALVNALAHKNREALWLELTKAARFGDAPEMLHGLLHWKARDMMEKGSPKWGKEGARKLSRELIALLSDSRSGDLPLKEHLERFALSI